MMTFCDHNFLLGYEKAIKLDVLEVEDQDLKKLLNGASVEQPNGFEANDIFYIKDHNKNIIGLGEVNAHQRIKVKKLLV